MRTRAALIIASVTLGVAACSSSPPPSGPDASQIRFLDNSATIDNRLGGDRQTTLKLGQKICAELASGKSDAQIAADAQRFSEGEGVIDKAQAAELVAAAKQHLCT